MSKENLSGKTWAIWKCRPNTGNLVCSSCKFPDSKGKKIWQSLRQKCPINFLIWINLLSQFCVWKNHKSRKLAQGKFAIRQEKNRENTGNLKMQFEWGPCDICCKNVCPYSLYMYFSTVYEDYHGSFCAKHKDTKLKDVQ